MVDMNDPQAVGAAFGAMLLGGVISEGPPPPDSPLGRIRAFTEKYGEDALTPDHWDAARAGKPLLPPS